MCWAFTIWGRAARAGQWSIAGVPVLSAPHSGLNSTSLPNLPAVEPTLSTEQNYTLYSSPTEVNQEQEPTLGSAAISA